MAFFNKKKNNETREIDNNNSNTNDLSISGEENSSNESDGFMNNFNELHDTLEQEIVETIGQGSEDVKNITIVLDDDEKNELKFVISAGKIKNIESTLTDFDISNRLNWVDSNDYSREELDAVSNILDNYDFFDALSQIAENNPVNGEKLAEIVASTYLERSYKSLVYGKDIKVFNIRTDWSIDSDSEIIEAYTISIDPEEIGSIVTGINNRTNEALEHLINRDDTVIYVNDNTDYEVLESDIERYIVGAAINMYEDGVNNGVVLDTLMQFSDGFSVAEVVETVVELQKSEIISFTDPYATIEFLEEEEEEEEVDEEESEDNNSDVNDEEEEDNYLEELNSTTIDHNYDDIINEPFSHSETGTPHLGGALTQYLQLTIDGGILPENTVDRINYSNQYNTLYEQSIQGIERAIDPAVKELNRSVDFYQQLSSLNKNNEVNTSSNLHTAVYSLEAERNDLNDARHNLLTELYHTINDNEDIDYELKELITDVILLKVEGIEQVKNAVYGSSSQYVPESEFNLNEETVPTYYSIIKELGIKEKQ